MHQASTRPVTIVFTDLEDSTRRWEEDPNVMDASLVRHDTILQCEIDRVGGVITKHRGDGVLAIFERPSDAVEATIAAQRALAVEQWPGPPLKVRMGVHTGEVRDRDGDVFGPNVNLAARIQDAAHGGQVLVSESTEPLVRNVLPPDVTLVDLGHWVLRNVHSPQHLFEVRHPSMPARFPRIRGFRPGRSSLPVPPSAYVDAADSIPRLASMLAASRLVTVVGPAGVGKSRLAIEVASEVESNYVEGVRWCPLASVDDPSLVSAAIASHLDLGGAVPSSDLLHALRDRHLLMLVDNCEHLQSTVRAIASEILQSCPGVTVLATSREPLRVAGERVYVVAPMIAGTETSPAVSLFRDRVSTAGATIDETPTNERRIAALCARLDGLPLAIELAAARVPALGLDGLEQRLDERFQLLTAVDWVDPSSPIHHRGLRDTVAWSYGLLDERQRSLFERLSVFRGGLTTEAAEAVCADAFTWQGLAEMSERSLVQQDVSSFVTRYEMLESVRAFAFERLVERGDDHATVARHARYYGEWAERVDRERSGPSEAEWVERELTEVSNLRAATAWSVEHGDADLALRLYVALYELASLQGHVEIFDWVDPFALLDSGHPLAPAALSMLALRQDPAMPASVELAERALALQDDANKPVHRLVLWAKGFAEASRGDLDSAAAAYRANAELIRSLEGENGHWISARSLVVMVTRDAAEARAVGRDARRVGQPSALANALLAIARTQAVDPTKALELTRQAYALAESVQNVRLLAYADLTAAGIARQDAAPDVALGHLIAALKHAVRARQHEPMWQALIRIGAVLRRAGLTQAAADVIEPWVSAFPSATARYPSLHADHGDDVDFRLDALIPLTEEQLCDRTVAIIDRLRRDGLLTPR